MEVDNKPFFGELWACEELWFSRQWSSIPCFPMVVNQRGTFSSKSTEHVTSSDLGFIFPASWRTFAFEPVWNFGASTAFDGATLQTFTWPILIDLLFLAWHSAIQKEAKLRFLSNQSFGNNTNLPAESLNLLYIFQ